MPVATLDDFLAKTINCKLCAKDFSTLTVKKSAQPVLKTDSDFCVHYLREAPYFYHVYVCPSCGYAFMDSFKRQPVETMLQKLSPLPDFFSEKRDASTAQLAYKRAIECAKLQREDDLNMASLYLHLSWIMRVKGDQVAEKAAQNEALAFYNGVYENADLADASRVMYLIGELHRRLDNKREAVFWYSRVVNDPRSAQAFKHMARDAWQSLRE